MKRLLILRHAKSSWSQPHAADFDRPLNQRGRDSARAIGQALRRADQVPQLVLASAAHRVRQTVELAMKEGQWGCPVEWRRDLYEADPQEVVELLRGVDGDLESVLVAGHQPTSAAVLSLLIGGGEVSFPTAALACIDVRVERWNQLTAGLGSLNWLLVPRLLRSIAGPSSGAP